MYNLTDFISSVGITHTCNHTDTPVLINSLNPSFEEFVILNPLKPNGLPTSTRRDEDVDQMINYLFELDDLSLDYQEELLNYLIGEDILTSAVYSGSKSIHFIIKGSQPASSKAEYQYVWTKINDILFEGTADKACKNPARLTRSPGYMRDNGYEQELLYVGQTTVDITEFINEFKVAELKKENKRVFEAILASYRAKTFDSQEFDLETYLNNIAQKKGSEYVTFINCGFGHQSYEELRRCIGWAKSLTHPTTGSQLLSNDEIFRRYVEYHHHSPQLRSLLP